MPATEQGGGDARRGESEHERLDRNLAELTGELRVVVTGVQVLFAFLLILPFNVGFEHVGAFERTVYIVTLALAMLAAVCAISPSAQHRWEFRQDDKRHILFSSNRVVIVGLALLAAAMCGCVLLVTTKLFGAGWGAVASAAASVPFIFLWFAVPMRRAAHLASRSARGGPSARRGSRGVSRAGPAPPGRARARPAARRRAPRPLRGDRRLRSSGA